VTRATQLNDALILIPDNLAYDLQVEALYARAFGPGRFAKAASRLREGNVCLRDYSVLALEDETVVGACRLWPVLVGQEHGALFLGPIAVDPTRRSAGLGQQLVEACLRAIEGASDSRVVILVGDLAYFSKMGFIQVPAGEVTLPGPVDPARLLWRQGRTQTLLPKGRLSVPHAASQKG
jgi:predicted N-acetyltransferase YhbS